MSEKNKTKGDPPSHTIRFALPYEPETQEVETENAGDKPKDKGGAVSKSSIIRNPVRNPIRP